MAVMDMPVTSRFDAFFWGRPDVEDLFEVECHEYPDSTGGEVHEKHLLGWTELERVAYKCAEFIHQIGFLNVGCAILD